VNHDDRPPEPHFVERLVTGRNSIKVALVLLFLMLPLLLAPLGLILLLIWLL
jgi:hypothetical protein